MNSNGEGEGEGKREGRKERRRGDTRFHRFGIKFFKIDNNNRFFSEIIIDLLNKLVELLHRVDLVAFSTSHFGHQSGWLCILRAG